MIYSQAMTGRSARTGTVQTHHVTWKPQRLRCCGQLIQAIQDCPPVYLDDTDAQPRSRSFQCGNCGSRQTATWEITEPPPPAPQRNVLHTEIVCGRSARTATLQSHIISWRPQELRCCGELIATIEDEPPVYLDDTDAQPHSRTFQCGNCGSRLCADWKSLGQN